MKEVRRFCGVVGAVAAVLAVSVSITQAEIQTGKVLIKAVQGNASYSTDGAWQPLTENALVTRGTVIKTGPNGTVDLILQTSGTVLRLTPNSKLAFDKLNKETAGEEVITETSLNLLAGSVIGSQRKLASPSSFDIKAGNGVAKIVGTEYLVRADGMVIVIDGSVTVNYNLPGSGGSVRVTVAEGFSFDPSTGQVIQTQDSFKVNIIADIDTVRHNAQVFKAGGATVVVKPQDVVSPTRGNNGVGNGIDPQPPGNPPVNDGPGTGPGNPGNGKGKNKPKATAPRTPST